MRRLSIVVTGMFLLTATGCASRCASKTESTTADHLKQHGMVSWHELMTTNVSASKDFYMKLFGWTTTDIKTDGMPYTMIKVDGKEVGGIMSMPPEAKGAGAPPNWGIYVTVDNVDATSKLAANLGAKILVAPRDIPDVGRFCVIQDPQGAVISAITYKCK
ncbi:MAG: VOC family protein [Pseudomonadota bacterium]